MVHATPTGAYHLLLEPPLSFRGALATRNLGLRHPSNARSPAPPHLRSSSPPLRADSPIRPLPQAAHTPASPGSFHPDRRHSASLRA